MNEYAAARRSKAIASLAEVKPTSSFVELTRSELNRRASAEHNFATCPLLNSLSPAVRPAAVARSVRVWGRRPFRAESTVAGAAVGAIATFHAGLNVGLPEDTGRIRSKVLINHGAEDPLVNKEAIDAFTDEMRREKVDWQFVYHGNTVHSFTEPAADGRGSPGFAYNKKVDERSWAAMRHLFKETFGEL